MRLQTIDMLLGLGILVVIAFLVWDGWRRWRKGIKEGFQAYNQTSNQNNSRIPGSYMPMLNRKIILPIDLRTSIATTAVPIVREPNRLRARFVRIQSIGGADYLNFSQIAVFDLWGNNVAQRKLTTSSGDYRKDAPLDQWSSKIWHYPSRHAVDGVLQNRSFKVTRYRDEWDEIWATEPYFVEILEAEAACGFSSDNINGWFEVDLGPNLMGNPEHYIQRTVIYNRPDECCAGRLSRYKLQYLAANRVVLKEYQLTGDLVQTYWSDGIVNGLRGPVPMGNMCPPQSVFLADAQSRRDAYYTRPCMGCPDPNTQILVNNTTCYNACTSRPPYTAYSPDVNTWCLNVCPTGYGRMADGLNCTRGALVDEEDAGTNWEKKCNATTVKVNAAGGRRCITVNQTYIVAYVSTGGEIFIGRGTGLFDTSANGSTSIWTKAPGNRWKKVMVKRGLLIAMNQAGEVFYGGAFDKPSWMKITLPLNQTFEDFSFDGVTLIILTQIKDNDPKLTTTNRGRDLYWTEGFYFPLPRWKLVGGPRFRNISHTGGFMAGTREFYAAVRDPVNPVLSYKVVYTGDYRRSNPQFLDTLVSSNNVGENMSDLESDTDLLVMRMEPNGIIYSVTLSDKRWIRSDSIGTWTNLSISNGGTIVLNSAGILYITSDDYRANPSDVTNPVGTNNVRVTQIASGVAQADLFIGTPSPPPMIPPGFLYTSFKPAVYGNLARCTGVRAQYVRVLPTLSTSALDGSLIFSQLFAFDKTGTNVALKKATSATNPATGVEKISTDSPVDGTTMLRARPYIYVSDNVPDRNANWWQVNLGSEIELDMLVIYIRSELNNLDSGPLKTRVPGMRIQLLNASMGIVIEKRLETDAAIQFIGLCTEGYPHCTLPSRDRPGYPTLYDNMPSRAFSQGDCTLMRGNYDFSTARCLNVPNPPAGATGNLSRDCVGFVDLEIADDYTFCYTPTFTKPGTTTTLTNISTRGLTSTECAELGGTYTESTTTCALNGIRARTYTAAECQSLGGTHDTASNLCKGVPSYFTESSGLFSVDCARGLVNPNVAYVKTLYDSGATGRCRYNPYVYTETYPDVLAAAGYDLRKLFDHFVGIGNGIETKSPCGSINVDCRFDGNNYLKVVTENGLSTQNIPDAKAHYKTQGILQNKFYCYTKGFIREDPTDRDLARQFISTNNIINPPSTLKCRLAELGTARQWLCDTEDDAMTIMKGPGGELSYVRPQDSVCVKDQNMEDVYYCKSVEVSDSGASYNFKIKATYDTTCDALKKNYYDMSGNLDALNELRSTVSWTTARLTAARDNLNALYTNLRCAGLTGTGKLVTICNSIQKGANDIGGNLTTANTTLKSITDPVAELINSRTFIKDTFDKFGCKL